MVIDRGRDEKTAPPYSAEELEAAKWAIDTLAGNAKDVGIASLEAFEQRLTDDRRQQLYPYQPKQLLLRRELDELFDTTPDLTGADIDVSPFIRSGDERDVAVFWLDARQLREANAPRCHREPQASREDGATSRSLRRELLCGKATKEKPAPRLLPSRRAWLGLDRWRVEGCRAGVAHSGNVICVAPIWAAIRSRGFDPESRHSAVFERAAASSAGRCR